MKLVGYLRVSTDAQVEGMGLPSQRSGITVWARRGGHKVVAWHADEGVSGSNGLEGREALRAVLDAVTVDRDGRRRADGVVVARLDRLARSLTVQEAVLGAVWSRGGSVHAVDQGEVPQDDPDDPMRTFLRQVVGAVSELERGLISKRLRDGRRQKHDGGGYAYGSPPYGFRSTDRELVEVDAEQAVLERMRAWRADGASYERIADRLNAEGTPAKRGGGWHAPTVSRALGRDVR